MHDLSAWLQQCVTLLLSLNSWILERILHLHSSALYAVRGGDYRGDASPPKILVGGTQMQASPQQLPLLVKKI